MTVRNLRIAIIAFIVLSALHGTPSLVLGIVKGVVMAGLIGLYMADRMHG